MLLQACGKKPVQAFGEGCLGDAAELWQLFSMLRNNLSLGVWNDKPRNHKWSQALLHKHSSQVWIGQPLRHCRSFSLFPRHCSPSSTSLVFEKGHAERPWVRNTFHAAWTSHSETAHSAILSSQGWGSNHICHIFVKLPLKFSPALTSEKTSAVLLWPSASIPRKPGQKYPGTLKNSVSWDIMLRQPSKWVIFKTYRNECNLASTSKGKLALLFPLKRDCSKWN